MVILLKGRVLISWKRLLPTRFEDSNVMTNFDSIQKYYDIECTALTRLFYELWSFNLMVIYNQSNYHSYYVRIVAYVTTPFMTNKHSRRFQWKQVWCSLAEKEKNALWCHNGQFSRKTTRYRKWRKREKSFPRRRLNNSQERNEKRRLFVYKQVMIRPGH